MAFSTEQTENDVQGPDVSLDVEEANALPRRCSTHHDDCSSPPASASRRPFGPQRLGGSHILSRVGSSVLTVNGTAETSGTNNVDPFIAEVFTNGGGECLQSAVTTQGADLKATLLSPGGTVWQDDDSGGSLGC